MDGKRGRSEGRQALVPSLNRRGPPLWHRWATRKTALMLPNNSVSLPKSASKKPLASWSWPPRRGWCKKGGQNVDQDKVDPQGELQVIPAACRSSLHAIALILQILMHIEARWNRPRRLWSSTNILWVGKTEEFDSFCCGWPCCAKWAIENDDLDFECIMHQKVAPGGFVSDTAWLTRACTIFSDMFVDPGSKEEWRGRRAHKRSRCRFLRSCFRAGLDAGGLGGVPERVSRHTARYRER